MRLLLNLVGLLLVLAIAAWIGKGMLRTSLPEGGSSPAAAARVPVDAKATLERTRRELDEAARAAAQRASDADR